MCWTIFRNTVELELKQECLQQLGVRRYVGPLTVALQELDGTFKHVLQIEGTHVKADIVCHSKSRRQKKKKIPLCTGEEVDMDLNAMEYVRKRPIRKSYKTTLLCTSGKL